jgi:transcription elongation GreA/GreB family factor
MGSSLLQCKNMSQNVVALVRVASEEQAVEGRGGIERQWRDIEAVCAREHLVIKEKFQLEGISGSTVKLNPKFQRMLKAVSGPDNAGLVISSPDRLMRCNDLSDLAILQPFGDESKPRLIWTAESTYNLRKLDGQLMFLMQTLVGGHEKKAIILRTQAGKNLSRERGDKCADKPPVGCEFVVTDAKARTGFYRFTSDANKIKRAFKRVLDRDTSIKSIAKELGFSSYQSMRKQLTNPIWTGWRVSDQQREKLPPGPNGELRYRKIPRLVPIRTKLLMPAGPLIKQEVFDEAQSILAAVNKEHLGRRAKGKTPFTMTGLLRCPCGDRYYSKWDGRDGKHGYYVCKSKYFDAAKGCGYGNLPRKTTDDSVVELLSEYLADKGRLMNLLRDAITPKDAEELKEERIQLQREIEVLTARRTKIVEKIADGLLSDAEARVAMAKIRSDIERATTALAEVNRKLKDTQVPDLPQIVISVVQLFTSVRFHPAERRKALIRQLVQSVQMGPDKDIVAITLRLGKLSGVCQNITLADMDSLPTRA